MRHTHELERFFVEQAEDLLANRITDMNNAFAFPLIVYAESGIRIMRTPEENEAALRAYRVSMMGGGEVVSMEARVVSVGELRGARLPVRIDWTGYSTSGKAVTSLKLRYFLRARLGGGWQVEMIEYHSGIDTLHVDAPWPDRPTVH